MGWPFILIDLGKKEKLRIEGKRILRLNTWGIISHHCCPVLSCQRPYRSTGSQGWPPLLGHKNCWESVKIWQSVCPRHSWFQYLATFGASGRFRKLHLQALGPTRQLPWPEHPCSLKRNFPSHQPFSDLLLSGSDLKKREFKEGGSWK
jgi:hypothetical protein